MTALTTVFHSSLQSTCSTTIITREEQSLSQLKAYTHIVDR